MRRYSVVQAPALAFYSSDLYRDVARHWRGAAFAYLLLLLAVCWLPAAREVQKGWARFVDNQGASLVAQIPPITIAQGVVTVDAEQPYYITDRDTKRVLAIIDTGGEVPPLNRTGALVFLGKDQLVVRKSATETRVYRLSGVRELHLDRGMAERWLGLSKRAAGPFVYLMALAGSYVFRVVEALVLAVIGLVIAKSVQPDLGFAASLSLSVMATTAPIVAGTVLEIGKVSLPHSGPIFFIVTLGYLWFGIAANRAPEAPPQGFASS